MAMGRTSVGRAAQGANRNARSAANSPGVHLLERGGIAARGIVYVIVGGLTASAAVVRGGGAAGSSQALKAIYGEPHGRVLLAVVTIGLFGYALFCFVRSLLDTEGKGNDAKGVVTRLGYAIVGFAYGAIAWGALQLIRGAGAGSIGGNASTQSKTAHALTLPFGKELVIIVGIVVIGLGLAQLYCAYTAKFQKELSLGGLAVEARRAVIALGRFGYAARGVVFAIVGFFLVIAGLHSSAGAAKGPQGALQALLAQPYGHLLAGIVALGLVAFGLYSIAEARYRRIGAA